MSLLKHLRIFLQVVLFFAVVFHSSQLSGMEDKEPLPNPLNLEVSWMDYFRKSNDDFDKKSRKLQELLAQISEQGFENKVRKIKLQLKKLGTLYQQEVEDENLVWIEKDHYTMQEYFDLAMHSKELELFLKEEALTLTQVKGSLDKMRENYNISRAKWEQAPANSEQKLLLGLDNIQLGLRILFLEATQNFIEEKIVGIGERKKRFSAEMEVASKKISAPGRQIFSQLEPEVGIVDSVEEALEYTESNLDYLKNAFYRVELEAGASLDLAKLRSVEAQQNYIKEQTDLWREEVIGKLNLMKDSNTDSQTKKKLENLVAHRTELEEISKKNFQLDLLIGLLDSSALESEGTIKKLFYKMNNLFFSLYENTKGWFYYSIVEVGSVSITLAGLLKAALTFIIAIIISSLVRRWVRRFSKKKGKVSTTGIYTLCRIIHYCIIIIGAFFSLGALGFTVKNMAIIIGALGIGVGFGFQGIVNNFLSGITILFERNVKIGDLIQLESGEVGKVTDVNVLNTSICTYDGLDVLVPNASLMNEKVINWTKKDAYLRLHVPFNVAYGTDGDFLTKIIIEASKNVVSTLIGVPGVADPEVWLVKFNDSSLDYELIVWVNVMKSPGAMSLKARYMYEIQKALAENRITIPFPQRDIHIIPNS